MTERVISKGGQISVPAHLRRRWGTDRVIVVDRGDHLVVRPAPVDPIAAAKGSMPLPGGLTSEKVRAKARREDEAIDQRRR